MKSEDSWGTLGPHPLISKNESAFFMATVYLVHTNPRSVKLQSQPAPLAGLCQALRWGFSHSTGGSRIGTEGGRFKSPLFVDELHDLRLVTLCCFIRSVGKVIAPFC